MRPDNIFGRPKTHFVKNFSHWKFIWHAKALDKTKTCTFPPHSVIAPAQSVYNLTAAPKRKLSKFTTLFRAHLMTLSSLGVAQQPGSTDKMSFGDCANGTKYTQNKSFYDNNNKQPPTQTYSTNLHINKFHLKIGRSRAYDAKKYAIVFGQIHRKLRFFRCCWFFCQFDLIPWRILLGIPWKIRMSIKFLFDWPTVKTVNFQIQRQTFSIFTTQHQYLFTICYVNCFDLHVICFFLRFIFCVFPKSVSYASLA